MSQTSKDETTDKAAIVDLLAGLIHAYPTYPVPKETVMVYVNHLDDIDLGLLERACRHWLQTRQHFPTIAEIRQIAKQQHQRELVEAYNRSCGQGNVSEYADVSTWKAGKA